MTASPKDQHRRNPVIAVIAKSSLWLSGISIVALLGLMLVEAAMRYLFSTPLGWNVSAAERFLVPGSVFFALPWLYATAGNVSAELLYDRLPGRFKYIARWITVIVVLLTAGLLAYGGFAAVVDAIHLGLRPLPGTSELPVPDWVWLLIQPVGALSLFAVALIDAPRYLRDDASPLPSEAVSDMGESVTEAGGSR